MGGCSNLQVLMDAYHFGYEKVGRQAMDEAFAVSTQKLLVGYFLTGLFENPYVDEVADLADVNSADKKESALQAQVNSLIEYRSVTLDLD